MPSKNNLSALKSITKDKEPVLHPHTVTEQAITKQSKPKQSRINKGFQVEKSRAAKWDMLVAQMKGEEVKKTGPELIDEALDYLFSKHLRN